MNTQLSNLIKIYNTLKSDSKNIDSIQEYSSLLHNELLEDFIAEIPDFYNNYLKVSLIGDKLLNSNNLSFSLKGNKLNILKNSKIEESYELLNVEKLLTFLSDKNYTKEQEQLIELFLSNSESIIHLNFALRIQSLDTSS